MDKWFTDLAAHAGVDNVSVSYWPKGNWFGATPIFSVILDSRCHAYGQTIEEAMTAALAKLRTSRALDTLGAIDGELLP